MRIRKERKPNGKTKYSLEGSFFSVYPGWKPVRFTVDKAGYFDERPQVVSNISYVLLVITLPLMIFFNLPTLLIFAIVLLQLLVGWGQFFLHLPIKTGIDDCEAPEYGFYYYPDTHSLVICSGTKRKYIYMPWAFEWVKTSALLANNPNWINAPKKYNPAMWEHEIRGDRKEFWKEEWKKVLQFETHPYIYRLKSRDTQEVTAEFTIRRMEWRRKWFLWTTLFNKVCYSIEINFSAEVGEKLEAGKVAVLVAAMI